MAREPPRGRLSKALRRAHPVVPPSSDGGGCAIGVDGRDTRRTCMHVYLWSRAQLGGGLRSAGRLQAAKLGGLFGDDTIEDHAAVDLYCGIGREGKSNRRLWPGGPSART